MENKLTILLRLFKEDKITQKEFETLNKTEIEYFNIPEDSRLSNDPYYIEFWRTHPELYRPPTYYTVDFETYCKTTD